MRKFFMTLASLCFAISIAYADSAQMQTVSLPNVKNVTTSPYSNLSLQFILNAKTVIATPLSKAADSYHVTCYDINPYVIYFSDRPQRIRGIVPLEQFIKTWGAGDNSFKKNNPNAAVVAAKINSSPNLAQEVILISVANPRYNSSKNTLTYTAIPLYRQPFMIRSVRLDGVTMIITS